MVVASGTTEGKLVFAGQEPAQSDYPPTMPIYPFSGSEEVVAGESAVIYSGESVFLNEHAMRPNYPYVFELGKVPCIAVRGDDGGIDVYAIP